MQAAQSLFIDGKWLSGEGKEIVSINPATGTQIWTGKSASLAQVTDAITAARKSLKAWKKLSIEQRCKYLEKFTQIITTKQNELVTALSQETGKPTWEAKTEIGAMLSKFEVSKQAYADRCRESTKDMNGFSSITRHKPHGVMVVLGPFNFPAHLPNGHIIPALLAGNTVVFKPSELTSHIAVLIMQCWMEADLPAGVLNLVIGAGEVGQSLVASKDIDGVLFTGSFATGHKIREASLNFPRRIVALEMGGNNPLVVYKPDNIDAAVYLTIQSAFTTAGQRCTCARRLIVVNDELGQQFVRKLIATMPSIKIGAYTEDPEPFMGPLISNDAADKVLAGYNSLVAAGAKVMVPMGKVQPYLAFLTPAIIDVTDGPQVDEEIFGPLLRLIWVKDLNEAIQEANNTTYGLSAGLICDDPKVYAEFLENINAGVVAWNRPTIGSSGTSPFGGLGKSGNHRPSAYYAADYCAYPVASNETSKLEVPHTLNPGLKV